MLQSAPALAAETISKWLDEAEIPSSQATDSIDPDALRDRHPLPKETQADGRLDYSRALDRLDASLPDDRVVITDAGRFMTEARRRIGGSAPQDFEPAINVGASGMGMGYAIGAAVARPGRKTIFFTGDGGFMMGGLAEFSAVVRENLNLVTIVANDAAYGAEHIQFKDRQMDPSLSMFNWPSFAATSKRAFLRPSFSSAAKRV